MVLLGSITAETTERIERFRKRIEALRQPRTAETYARCATMFERFLAETDTDVSRATLGFLDDFVQWMIRRGLEPAGVKLVVVGTRKYLEYRRRSGETISEFELPDIPTGGKRKAYIVLTDRQLGHYLGAVCEYPDPVRTMMLLLPMTGLRADEISHSKIDGLATREDIPLAIHVVGKGNKPRMVPVGKQGRKILKMYLETWRSKTRPDVSWLFPGQGKQPIRNRTLRKAITKIAQQINFPGLHPHCLRRTYITYLAGRHVPALMIAQLVGHGRPLEEDVPSVTQRYVQFDLVTMAREIEKIMFPAPILRSQPEASA